MSEKSTVVTDYRQLIDANAKISVNDNFIYVNYPGTVQHDFFWKFHVTSTLEDYPLVAHIAIRLLNQQKMDFKFVNSIDKVYFFLGGSISAAESGKLITVYPADVESMKSVMVKLEQRLSLFHGPQILTDRAFGESDTVYYRFGEDRGNSEHRLSGPHGEIFIDDRRPVFHIPDWLGDPFTSETKTAYTGSVLQDEYRLTRIIHHNAWGVVMKGSDRESNAAVCIKEARKDVLGYSFGSTTKLEKRASEYVISNLLWKDCPFVVKPVDYVEERFSTFFIYEWDSDKTLINFPAKVTPYTKLEILHKACDVLSQLLSAISKIHDAGFENIDISAANLTWSGQRLRFVDLDSLLPLGARFRDQTKYYWLDVFKTVSGTAADFRRAGMLGLYLLGDYNYSLTQHKNISQTLHLVSSVLFRRGLPLAVVDLLTYLLLEPNPEASIAIKKAKYAMDQSRESPENQDINSKTFFADLLKHHPITVFDVPLSTIIESDEVHKMYFAKPMVRSLPTGLAGLGGALLLADRMPKAEGARLRGYVTEEVQNRLSTRDTDTDVRRYHDENVFSPYLEEGTAGLLLGMLFSKNQAMYKATLARVLPSLSALITKSPDLWGGLTGLVWTELVAYLTLGQSSNVELASVKEQIVSIIDMLVFHDGSGHFYLFPDDETQDEGAYQLQPELCTA
ncbi:hypothetical protein [Schleiferilactobacillus shenzhenensis]|uniref:RamC N-terminal domain-containing protein n=1 Tax=Schleiferilactobacillus shenzhenensis LY-73 TaxID=1231336 RepID=U4TG59_9LACO|nr:hypothetical protein [Schleiferilactobacillus shenzhenensis]ERL63756.1 hypothetical protein L248_2225 [Schleiferilactobacillus shenzhenensis LY-73]